MPFPAFMMSLPSTRSKSSPLPPRTKSFSAWETIRSDRAVPNRIPGSSLPNICDLVGTATPFGTAKTFKAAVEVAVLTPSAAIAVRDKSKFPDDSELKLIFKSSISVDETRQIPSPRSLPALKEQPRGIPAISKVSVSDESKSPLTTPISNLTACPASPTAT